MSTVRNIIFDYGQVIINLDVRRTQLAFERAGVKDFSSVYSLIQQRSFFDLYDRGNCTDDDFRNAIREYGKIEISDNDFDDCWSAMLLDIPKPRIEFLTELKKNYKTFLLSNTNFIHLKRISAYLSGAYGITDIEPFFNKVYYSCKVGMRKPEPEIFQMVLNENNLLPEECVFIDDVEKNISVAGNLGMQTILIKPEEEVVEKLSNFLSIKSSAL